MEDCLFCKITPQADPQTNCRDDTLLASPYDIDPQAPVHFPWLIPKRHIASAAALTEDDAALLGLGYLCRDCAALPQAGCG